MPGFKWLCVTLKCGHVIEFEAGRVPSLGETIYCRRCNTYERVVLASAKYSIRCLNCRYSRATYGHVRLSAERDISNHLKKCPSHSVQLWNGLQLEHTFTPDERGMKTLDTEYGDPPY